MNTSPVGLFRAENTTVMVPVHVTNSAGRPLLDLKRDNFTVYDDGVQQNISYFAAEDAPVSVGILVDASGSMRTKMVKAREAVAKFLTTANALDEFFMIEFNDRAKFTVPFTDDLASLISRVGFIKPSGRTSLYDAVWLALLKMKGARYDRRALMIFSDGGDNSSRRSLAAIRNQLFESDVQMYALGIYPSDEEPPLRTSEEIRGPSVLEELASGSGGRHFTIRALQELPDVAAQISLALRSQYLLGYSPSSGQRDGRYHRVKVNVEPADKVWVQYRNRYFTPLD